MSENHAGGVFFEAPQSDEPFALENAASVWNRETLIVGVKAGCVFALQDAVRDPRVELLSRARVNVVALGIFRESLAERDANEIVGAEREIARLHGRRDLVVRLGDEIFDAPGLRAVAVRLERIDACQGIRITGGRRQDAGVCTPPACSVVSTRGLRFRSGSSPRVNRRPSRTRYQPTSALPNPIRAPGLSRQVNVTATSRD